MGTLLTDEVLPVGMLEQDLVGSRQVHNELGARHAVEGGRRQRRPQVLADFDGERSLPHREQDVRRDVHAPSAPLHLGAEAFPEETIGKEVYTSKEMVDVPVIGKITAGEPILAVENVTDTFPIPLDFVGTGESFMLTVRGESMIEAGILDGDYILVRKQNTANNGEIVVALIEDEATVKTFYKEKDHIRLQPQNPTMDPIIVPNCQILGKVSGVFRKIK